MPLEQTALAIITVFFLLAVIVFKFGRQTGHGTDWLARMSGKAQARRIAHIESRVLPGGCTLHLINVDGRAFLLAHTGGSCTSIRSWNAAQAGEKS